MTIFIYLFFKFVTDDTKGTVYIYIYIWQYYNDIIIPFKTIHRMYDPGI